MWRCAARCCTPATNYECGMAISYRSVGYRGWGGGRGGRSSRARSRWLTDNYYGHAAAHVDPRSD
eukprot:scaffold14497_cov116-Isochrysis_galbana.AAC.3